MYIYFDRNGKLKEIINDTPLRVGNDNVNKVFCYFEDLTPDSATMEILRNGDTEKYSRIATKETFTIPYEEERDLKYFEAEKSYKGFSYTLDTTDLAVNGLLQLTCLTFNANEEVLASGMILLNVENTSVATTTNITESEFEYLKRLVSSFSSVYECVVIGSVEEITENQETSLDENRIVINYYNGKTKLWIVKNGKYTLMNGFDSELKVFLKQTGLYFNNLEEDTNYTIDLTTEEWTSIDTTPTQVIALCEGGNSSPIYLWYQHFETTGIAYWLGIAFKTDNTYLVRAVKDSRHDEFYIKVKKMVFKKSVDEINATIDTINIQLKDIYTKEEVDNIIENVKTNEYQVVSMLPSEEEAEEGIIYLLKDTETENNYKQYIWEQKGWLFLGNTQIDLSAYYTKEKVDELVNELDDEIATNKTNIANNTSNIDKNAVAIQNNVSSINTLNNKIDSVESSLSTTNARIETAEGVIAVNRNLIDAHETKINNCTSAIKTHTSDIATNASNITANTNKINSLSNNLPDDLYYTESENKLYLSHNGTAIGNGVTIKQSLDIPYYISDYTSDSGILKLINTTSGDTSYCYVINALNSTSDKLYLCSVNGAMSWEKVEGGSSGGASIIIRRY